MYDALKMQEETKCFETYLLIQSRIKDECGDSLKNVLLQKLDQKYLAGAKAYELMEVLTMMHH